MESIDLFTCLAKITKIEETTRYHIKEDLIKLRCLDPVQVEAIRILGNQIIGKAPNMGKRLISRPSSWNSLNRTSSLSKFRRITGSSLLTESLENIFDMVARRVRCRSWSVVAPAACEKPNTWIMREYLSRRRPLEGISSGRKEGSLTCSSSGVTRTMWPYFACMSRI